MKKHTDQTVAKAAPSQEASVEEIYAEVAPDQDAAIDDALGLQPISIRLQKSLLDNLKALAQLNGIGYQPLVRQILTRWVDCELKNMLRERMVQERAAMAEKEIVSDPKSKDSDEKFRLAA